jgi:hypothetical protein
VGGILEFLQNIGPLEKIAAEHQDHFRRMLRMMAVKLVEVGRQTATELSSSAAAFVREHLGQPPYPKLIDVMLEDPEFRKQYESAKIAAAEARHD